MAKRNRTAVQLRSAKRKRVYYASIQSDEIAYFDPVENQVEVVKMRGRDKRFQTAYLQKSPTFAELHKVEPGSANEKSYLRSRILQGLSRYSDPRTGTELG